MYVFMHINMSKYACLHTSPETGRGRVTCSVTLCCILLRQSLLWTWSQSGHQQTLAICSALFFPGPWIKCLRPHLVFNIGAEHLTQGPYGSAANSLTHWTICSPNKVSFLQIQAPLPARQAIYQLYPSPSHQLAFPLSSWVHCLYLCARFPFHVCIYPWVLSARQLLGFKVNERSGLSS